jgi:hypothetical protein
MDVLQTYIISLIRTGVPMAIGFIITWLATRGINLNSDGLKLLTLFLEGATGIAYYGLIRVLELIHYRWGWLLGYAKMPSYEPLSAQDPKPAFDPGSGGLDLGEQVSGA